jgi:hypothetical protein
MHRRRAIARSVAPAIAVLVVGASGCGGDSGGGSGPSILGRAFQGRAQAVCRTTLAQKKALGPFPFPDFNPTRPDRSKLPAIARLEARTVAIYRSWDDRMRALGPPPSGRAEWTALVASLRRQGAIIADQQAAAARGDAARFTRDFHTGDAGQAHLVATAKAADLPACADAAAA